MTAPPGTPAPSGPPPQPTGPTHPTPTGPGRLGTNPHPSAPEPGPGQPPQPVPRGYTSAPFGHTAGRYGYMVAAGCCLMAVPVGAFLGWALAVAR